MERAYKFGAGRYHQSRGAAALLGDEARRLGAKNAYIIAGKTAFSVAGDRLVTSLNEAGVAYHLFLYGGQCSVEQANACAEEAQRLGCDLIVGVGGGRMMDLSKATARVAHLPVITVPTLSATSAPFTHMSVMYTPDGHWVGTWYLPTEVSAVLADMDYLMTQPKRYIAAGAVDAMAKWMEICHPREEETRLSGDTLMARVIAEQVFTRLALLTPSVCAADFPNEDDLWETCFLSIAGAAMVSGTARCLRQSALAHAFYEWTRRFHPDQVKGIPHGEIVGVGLIMQGAYNADPAMLSTLENTLQALHMARCMTTLHLTAADAMSAAQWLADATTLVPADKRDSLDRAAKCIAK